MLKNNRQKILGNNRISKQIKILLKWFGRSNHQLKIKFKSQQLIKINNQNKEKYKINQIFKMIIKMLKYKMILLGINKII